MLTDSEVLEYCVRAAEQNKNRILVEALHGRVA